MTVSRPLLAFHMVCTFHCVGVVMMRDDKQVTLIEFMHVGEGDCTCTIVTVCCLLKSGDDIIQG